MATVITDECINCGACEPECPNTAIYQGGIEWELNGAMRPPLSRDIFYIVPEKCTECVGFYDYEACAGVCPVDCCLPDPKSPEIEAQLIGRARQLHPDVTFPPDFPSRFRKEGATAPAAAPAPAVTVPAVAPPAPPVTPAARPAPPAAPPAVAPPVVAAAPPAAPPAPPRVPAAPAVAQPSAATPAAAASAPVAARVPRPAPAAALRPAGVGVEKAVEAPAALKEAPGPKQFTGELPDDFEDLLGRLRGSSRGRAGRLARLAALLARPVAEMLPRGAKERLEEVVSRRASRTRTSGTTAFDGFYDEQFDEKHDRQRRYGEVYRLEDLGRGYLLRLEFPRRVPPSAVKEDLGIPDEMPDYDYELALANGSLVVRGKVVDPQVRKLTARGPAFPPDFSTRIDLGTPVRGFKHRYRDKTLEVVLVTQS